jgi:hypothetical protein
VFDFCLLARTANHQTKPALFELADHGKRQELLEAHSLDLAP